MPPEQDDDSGFDSMDALYDTVAGGDDDGAGGGSPGGASPPAPGGNAPGGTGSPAGAVPSAPPADPWRTPVRGWPQELSPYYNTFDPKVQQFLHQREQSYQEGFGKVKGEVDKWNEVFAPYKDFMQQEGGAAMDPRLVTKSLMDAHLALLYGDDKTKQTYAQHIVKEYGLDKLLGLGGQQPPGQAPQPVQDPRIDQLEQKLQTWEQRDQQRMLAEKTSEVEAFLADPKNEFASALIDDMIAITKREPQLGLAAAYERAMWTNGTVRGKLLQREIEKAGKPPVPAPRTPKASAGAGAHPPGTRQPKETLEDEMSAVWDEMQARTGR